MLNKIARTLEILYEYEVSEQQQSFKSMMKMTVRRAATSGVGWTRLGFQRVLAKSPDLDSRIADIQNQLDLVERISADLADDEVDRGRRRRRGAAADLAGAGEGAGRRRPRGPAVHLAEDRPPIIPDPRCIQLRDFLGCDWVAEEFCLSVNEVQETYGVDVSKSPHQLRTLRHRHRLRARALDVGDRRLQ